MNDTFARVLTGRGLTAAAVSAVAAVAGYASYTHIEDLAATHGATPMIAHLMPVSVDGLIIASSAALLSGAGHAVARLGLGLGIVATLYANVESGIRSGVVGALVALWPAIAFIVASEILLGMVRRAATTPTAIEPVEAVSPDTDATVDDVAGISPVVEPLNTVATPLVAVPATVSRKRPAARPKSPERMFAAELERGELPSLREVMRRASVGQPRARIIRDQLAQALEEARPEAAL